MNLVPLIDADMIQFRAVLSLPEGSTLELNKQRVDQMYFNLSYQLEDMGNAQSYLTGKGNYRKNVATYKANRKGTSDAIQSKLWEIRSYIITKYSGILCEGFEADDALGIVQSNFPGRTCIVSTDKDLDQISGWHFNFAKKEFYHVDQDSAELFYHQQFLIGDVADNIKGITGMGPARSANAFLLPSLDSDSSSSDKKEYLPPAQRWSIIQELYKKEYGNEWQQKLEENQLQLRILRSVEELNNVLGEQQVTLDTGKITLVNLLTQQTLDSLTKS